VVPAAEGPAIWTSDEVKAPTSPPGIGVSRAHGTARYLQINGAGFTVGEPVLIGFYWGKGDDERRFYRTTTTRHDGYDGGSFGYMTDLLSCEGQSDGYPHWVAAVGWQSKASSKLIKVMLCDQMSPEPPDTTLESVGLFEVVKHLLPF
jgi:hypothetical protein